MQTRIMFRFNLGADDNVFGGKVMVVVDERIATKQAERCGSKIII